MLHYVVAALAVLVTSLVFMMLRARAQRAKERKGLASPLETDPLLIHGGVITKHSDDGTLLDFYRDVTRRAGWKNWAWSVPHFTQYVITNPDDLKYIFHTNFENYTMVNRKPLMQELLGDGIFNTDGEQWREQRRSSSHLFTANKLKEHMMAVFTEKAHQLTEVIKAEGSKDVDLQRLMFCYTFDSISEIAFGRSVDSLAGNKKDRKFQDAFDTSQKVIIDRYTSLLWKVYRILGVSFEREMKESLKVIDQYIADVLAERKSPSWKSSGDVLTLFQIDAEKEGRVLGDQDLRDITLNFMIAGRDTTAAASTWMMYELARSPAVLAKVREEVKLQADVDNMQYLQAVFQETLRLHPPVPLDSKTCMADDVLPSGTRIAKGSDVGFHPCVFTMNPSLYPEPEKFLPERWMGDDGMCKQYDQWLYPQFNMGRRICLGRHMAAIEAKTVISELVTEFDFALVEGFVPSIRQSIVLQSRNGMMMRLTPRA